MSVARDLAELIKREAAHDAGWPEGCFDLLGSQLLLQGGFEDYMSLLRSAYGPENLDGLMWRGRRFSPHASKGVAPDARACE